MKLANGWGGEDAPFQVRSSNARPTGGSSSDSIRVENMILCGGAARWGCSDPTSDRIASARLGDVLPTSYARRAAVHVETNHSNRILRAGHPPVRQIAQECQHEKTRVSFR